MTPNKVIFDTDPGCDDIIALLFALALAPDDIEVSLISVTYGNVDVQNCLRNVLSMFHVIEKEMAWRKAQGLPEGFEALTRTKPIVAAGAKTPLGKTTLMADYYHGVDGLGNVHATHPHHTNPESAWKHLFEPPVEDTITSTANSETTPTHSTPPTLFTPSHQSSTHEILHLLRTNPPNTITLIAIGPLTNFAAAAALDPLTFLRAKQLLVMGGALQEPGNITPVAEFNCIADPVAAARVYALTSPNPASTMPPPVETSSSSSSASANAQDGDAATPKATSAVLADYPPLSRLGTSRLNIVLFPLDITTPHTLTRGDLTAATADLISQGSPLAEWTAAFIEATFQKSEALYHGHGGADTYMCLHDPLPVWYALNEGRGSDGWKVEREVDVRVETAGQWTRGMLVVDRRGMKMLREEVRRDLEGEGGDGGGVDDDDLKEVSGDSGGWLSRRRGNRVGVCTETPGERALAPLMMRTIFGGR